MMPQNQEEEHKAGMEKQEVKQDDEINLLDYLIVLLKHKKLIIAVTLTFAVIATIVSLILPKEYDASARILPPQQGSSSVASQLIGQFAGGLSSMAGGILGANSQGDLYVDLLNSRTIADRIIKRFDLMKLYDEEYMVDTRKKLDKNADISADRKSDIVTITVSDEDPKRAADMANSFVEELKGLTQGLAITEASQRRLFFEEQLKATKDALTKSEEELRAFQEQTGALKVEDQAKAVIDGIAALMAQIAAKEVEIKVMRTYSTPNNPDLQKTEESLRGMKAELRKLEAKGEGGSSSIIPTGRIPIVGTEYVRKMRDEKFNETLFGLIAQQYEAAKLDEARDAAVIQVVDNAVPPDKKARPKRSLIVVIATFVGFFLSVFTVFFMEYLENSSRDPENQERFSVMKKYLWWRRKSKPK